MSELNQINRAPEKSPLSGQTTTIDALQQVVRDAYGSHHPDTNSRRPVTHDGNTLAIPELSPLHPDKPLQSGQACPPAPDGPPPVEEKQTPPPAAGEKPQASPLEEMLKNQKVERKAL